MNELLRKHIAFWRCENSEPLLHKIDFPGFRPKPYPVSDGRHLVNPTPMTASDVDVERLLGLDRTLPEPIAGGMVNAIGPVYSEAWMESLIGCPILASAYSCTAKPCAADTDCAAADFSVHNAVNSDWSNVMDKVLARAVSAADGRISVRQLHLRGIIDMLAAYFGEERLCLNVCDSSRALQELSKKFTELYIKTVQRGFILRKSWQGGFVSSWGLFAPGRLLDYQVDASNLMSAQMYEQCFLKFDRQIIDAFEYSLVHVHACGLHIVKLLLKLDNLRAIEISLDRETGRTDISAIINMAKSIQDCGKAVLIYGEVNENELTMLTRHLNPNGLAIFYWHPNKIMYNSFIAEER
ncbi:MAG: hypothetical protein ACYC54_13740 [Sedimentisphaerales bacterium]